jgi:hypothetical protein
MWVGVLRVYECVHDVTNFYSLPTIKCEICTYIFGKDLT